MLKRREFLKSTVAALSVVSAWLSSPVASIAKTRDMPPELDRKTLINRWSTKSEYQTKRLTGYGALYGGSRDLGAIIDFVTDYHVEHHRFPRGWHIVTRYFRGMNPVGTRRFNVCFPSAWGDDGEPVDFFDANGHARLALMESILNGRFRPGQRVQ